MNQDSAIYYFEKMVMVSPTNKEYLLKGYNGLMYTYLKKKDGAKALYFANKMHEIDPYDRTYLMINDLIEHKE